MSSLRNSLHRKNHKERSQLAHRSRLGILEKHKDYVLRARDYHSKQDRIQRLRQKAAERNKDEFYFAMTRQRTERGVHVQDRGNQSLPVDIVKVLKTQDENYLRTMRSAGLKKIDKLKNQLSELADLFQSENGEHSKGKEGLAEDELEVLREAGVIATPSLKRKRKSKHFVFVDSSEQVKQYTEPNALEDVVMHAPSAHSSEEVDSGWRVPKQSTKGKRTRTSMSMEQLQTATAIASEEQRAAAKEHRTRLLKELSARLARDKQLRYAERELEMQRLLMGKGASRKLSGVEEVKEDDEAEEDEDKVDAPRRKKSDEKTWKPRVYKWRVERKR